MESIYQTRFSSTLMTSVFAGLAATLLCMVYYLGFKGATGFPFSIMINVSSMIFGINILFLLIGLVYTFFTRFFRRGEIGFVILFITATALGIFGAMNVHRSDDQLINRQFHELLAGMILVVGVCAFAGIPFLYHNKKFNDNVL